MPRAKIDANCLVSLAGELSRLWRGAGCHPFAGESKEVTAEDGFNFIAAHICGQDFERKGQQLYSPGNWLRLNGSTDLSGRLAAAVEQFIAINKKRLAEQGLSRFSEAGLRAFCFSALFEELRFGGEAVEEKPAQYESRRPPCRKRRVGSYFSPPALAYLAAERALALYFGEGEEACAGAGGGQGGLPSICDPAMGTGLFLVAALDYLSYQRPKLDRWQLAQTIAGVDFDAITAGAARFCLALAAGAQNLDEIAKFSGGCRLRFDDGLIADLPRFDIVLGNPPWDIAKTSSGSRLPSRVIKARTAGLRKSFEYQGEGDTSYYKLFVERSYRLLKDGGSAALLTPASLCGDKGAGPLRRLLLDSCRWQSIDGFINEDGAFSIHPQFKFLLVTFQKGGMTEEISSKFGLLATRDFLLGGQKSRYRFQIDRQLIALTGGQAGAIVELRGAEDAAFIADLYGRHLPLKNFLDESGANFKREFDMTLDRQLFVKQKRLDHADPFMPLLEGGMIGQFDSMRPESASRYYVRTAQYRQRVQLGRSRVGFVSVSSPYNTRSMVAAYLADLPTGNSITTLVFGGKGKNFQVAVEQSLFATAIFNSFVFDTLVRLRLAGNNLSYHLLQDLPFPSRQRLPAEISRLIVILGAALSFSRGQFQSEIQSLLECPEYGRALQAIFSSGGGPHLEQNRLRWRIWLELLVCRSYGLTLPQVAYMLRDCQVDAEILSRRRRLRSAAGDGPEDLSAELDQRSFFRVDKVLPPRMRLTNLLLETFAQFDNSDVNLDTSFSAFLSGVDAAPALPPGVEAALRERFAWPDAKAHARVATASLF